MDRRRRRDVTPIREPIGTLRRRAGDHSFDHGQNVLDFVLPRDSRPREARSVRQARGPALQGAGGGFLARGLPAKVYELGLEQRTVVVEFASVAQAIAAHDSPAYQEALRALGNGVDRELRIIEGAE